MDFFQHGLGDGVSLTGMGARHMGTAPQSCWKYAVISYTTSGVQPPHAFPSPLTKSVLEVFNLS